MNKKKTLISLAVLTISFVVLFASFQNFTAPTPVNLKPVDTELNLELSLGTLMNSLYNEKLKAIEVYKSQNNGACQQAGLTDDRRSRDQMYLCGEYPIGSTDVGIPPKYYDPQFILKSANQLMADMKRTCSAYYSNLRVFKFRGDLKVESRSAPNSKIMSQDFPVSLYCSSLVRPPKIKHVRRGRTLIEVMPKASDLIPPFDDTTLNQIKTRLTNSFAGNKSVKAWEESKTLAQASVQYQDKESLKTLNFTALMSRKQNSSQYILKSLTKNGEDQTFELSSDLWGRQHLQFIPKNGVLYVNSCMFYPGFNIDIPRVNGSYKYIHKWYLKAGIDFSFYAGGLNFSRLEVCGLIKVANKATSGAPQFKAELIHIANPKLIGAQFRPASLRIESRFWASLVFVADLVGANLSKKINDKINQTIQTFVPSEKELSNGSWIKLIPSGTIKKQFVADYNKLVKSIENQTNPVSNRMNVLQNNISKLCSAIMSKVNNSAVKSLIYSECSEMFESSNISELPFVANPNSQKLKCYSNSASIDENVQAMLTQNIWSNYSNQSWYDKKPEKGCRLTALQIKGTFSPSLAQVLRCTVALQNEKLNIKNALPTVTNCDQEMAVLAEDLLRKAFIKPGEIKQLDDIARRIQVQLADPKIAAVVAKLNDRLKSIEIPQISQLNASSIAKARVELLNSSELTYLAQQVEAQISPEINTSIEKAALGLIQILPPGEQNYSAAQVREDVIKIVVLLKSLGSI